MGDEHNWCLGVRSVCPSSIDCTSATHVAILLQVRRVVQIREQCLAKIVNGQSALLGFCPVRVVAEGVDADVSEAGLEGQPFLWPEGGRV